MHIRKPVNGRPKPTLPRSRGLLFPALCCCCLLAACSTSHHRKSADKEVYAIIEEVEQEVFGTRTDFSIDTRYSHRSEEDIAPEEIILDRQLTETRTITIEEALDLAVRNSREYQTEKERMYLTALTLTGERYAFGPQFFAGSTASLDRSPDGERSVGVNSRVGVSQALMSGASIGASIANDFLRFYTGDPRRSVVSTLSVNLVQPLLRGAGRSIAAESLKQAERNVIYSLRSFSQFQRQFAVNIVLDYFDLLQNKDQLRNAFDDYQRRLETIRYTEAHGEAGRVSQLEVDEARTEEFTAKDSYLLAATTYLNNLDRFKLTLGLPLTTRLHLDDSALAELAANGLSQLQIERERALAIAITNHLILLNEIDQFEDRQRQVKIAANQLKADMNLFADASLGSEEPTDYTSFDFDEVRAGVGIQLDLPIDRLRERNNYRATLVNFEAAIRTLSLEIDSKKDQIDSGLRTLERLRRSYFIQTNAVAIAERRVEGEQLSQMAGRRTVRNVRDAQDGLIRSQDSLTSSLVGHLGAKLQLLLDIGILNTDEEKFWIRDNAVSLPLHPGEPAADLLQNNAIAPPDEIFKL